MSLYFAIKENIWSICLQLKLVFKMNVMYVTPSESLLLHLDPLSSGHEKLRMECFRILCNRMNVGFDAIFGRRVS